jgi:hypothetical protein
MARRILTELKWHPGRSLKGVLITYIHRGALGDVVTIESEDIVGLEKSFMVVKGEVGEKRIPYHRIIEIRKGKEILWKKGADVSRSEK